MAEKKGRVSSKRSTGTKYKDLDKKFKFLIVFGIIFCIAGIPMIIWGGMWAYNSFVIIDDPTIPPDQDPPPDPPPVLIDQPVLSIYPLLDYDGDIHITWTRPSNAESFSLYRSWNDGIYTTILSNSMSNSFDDNDLPDGMYDYYVFAENFDGSIRSPDSDEVSVKVDTGAEPDYTREPYLYSVILFSDGEVDLAWSIESTTGHTDYVQRKKDGESYINIKSLFSDGGIMLYTDTLVEHGSFAYRIKSVYPGFWTNPTYYSNEKWVTFVGIKPDKTTVQIFSPNPDSDGVVTVRWSAVDNVIEYELYRSTDGVSFTRIATTTTIKSSSYIDTGLLAETYYYKVLCVGLDFDSDFSNMESVTVQFPIIIPIATKLHAITSPNTDGIIFINWDDVPNTDEYELHRGTDGISFTRIAPTITLKSSSYTDTILLAGTYYYKVVCVGQDGNSPDSNIVSVMVQFPLVIPDAPVLELITPNPNTDGNVDLNWDVVTNAISYVVCRDDIEIATPSTNSYTDPNLADGTYDYKIRSIGVDGDSDYSNTKSVLVEIYVSPVLPTNPTISINNGDFTTNSFDVSLILGCNDADMMRFKLSSDTGWTVWEVYGTTKSITLPETSLDNPYFIVKVQYRNADGETGEDDAVDMITYEELLEEEDEEELTEPIISGEQIGIIIIVVVIVVPVVIAIKVSAKKRKSKS